MFVPSILLKQLYTHGSLTKTANGLSFTLKNRLKDAILTQLLWIKIDDQKIPHDDITLTVGKQRTMTLEELNQQGDLNFPLKSSITVNIKTDAPVHTEKYTLSISFIASPFGTLKFEVKDVVTEQVETSGKVSP